MKYLDPDFPMSKYCVKVGSNFPRRFGTKKSGNFKKNWHNLELSESFGNNAFT